MIPTAHLGLNSEHRAEADRISRGWFFRPTMNYGDYRGYTFVLAGLIGGRTGELLQLLRTHLGPRKTKEAYRRMLEGVGSKSEKQSNMSLGATQD
jgi:hypothetical protein